MAGTSPPDIHRIFFIVALPHARYCLNDPSIRGGRESATPWRLGKQWKLEKLALFSFHFRLGSARLGSASLKAQTMLISQRVSSIYKSIPGGCLAGAPVCARVSHRLCVFFILSSFPPASPTRKETFISRNFISSGLSIGRSRGNKEGSLQLIDSSLIPGSIDRNCFRIFNYRIFKSLSLSLLLLYKACRRDTYWMDWRKLGIKIARFV